MSTLKTLTLVSIDDSRIGESQGILNEFQDVIGFWPANDAEFKPEYFGEFMKSLGVEVLESGDKKLKAILKKHIKKNSG